MKAIFMLHDFFPLFTMNLEFHSYSKNSVLVIVVRSKDSFINLDQVVSETDQVWPHLFHPQNANLSLNLKSANHFCPV